jgi:RNA polymerase sigma-70 factor (ECF subfamily)
MTCVERADRCTAEGPSPLSDHELLRLFRMGDKFAATEIYLRYADRLRALARTHFGADLARCIDADDIVQSVFGSFFRRVSSGCYDVPDGEELWKLFLVIALNKIRDRGDFHHAARRDVRRLAVEPAIGDNIPDRAHDDESRLHLQFVIRDLLEPLPTPTRRLIELRLEGHEVAEIARLTGRSKRTVERNLQTFRKKLGKALGRED